MKANKTLLYIFFLFSLLIQGIPLFSVPSCLVETTCSRVEALIDLEISCCDLSKTSFDALFSDIDALTGLQETCCDQTLSAFDLMTTGFEILFQEINYVGSGIEFIGSEITVLSNELEYAFQTIGSALSEIQNCVCCQYEITPEMITAGGYTITNSGIYCLVSDVVYVNGPAITITAPFNQVILDLGGHTITQDPFIPGTGPTIVVNGSGGGSLIIRNGATSSGDGHIVLNDAQFTILQDLRLNYTTSGYSSVQLNNCNGVIIDNVKIRYSGKHGFEANNSVGCIIKNCLVEQCSQTGAFMSGCMNCSAENVKSFSNNANGFSVEQSGALSLAQGILYKECVAENNFNSGFLLVTDDASQAIAGVTYQSCFASGNNNFGGFKIYAPVTAASKVYDVSYENCVAIENSNIGFGASSGAISNGVLSVVYESCTAQGNTVAGFEADAQSIVIKNCAALGNGTTGGISLGALSNACQVLECNVAENIGIGIIDSGTNNIIYGNVSSNNSSGNYTPSVPLTLKPTDITGSWINVDPNATAVGEYESKIDALIDFEQSCCTDILSSIDTIQCGSACQNMITNGDIAGGGAKVISDPGVYCLAENVKYNTSFAIEIVNNSVGEIILDLQGHSIIGEGTGYAIYITGTTGSVRITNGSIYDGEFGIYMNGAENVFVDNLSIFSVDQYAIYNVDSSKINFNNISLNSTAKDALYFLNCNKIIVQDSQIETTSNMGINLDHSNSALFSNVKIYSVPSNGFNIQSENGDTYDITIKDCLVNSAFNAAYGVFSGATGTVRGVLISNCYANNSVSGYYVETTGNNSIINVVLQNCIAQGNGEGFHIQQNGIAQLQGVVVQSCIADGNRDRGYYVRGVDSTNLPGVLFDQCDALRTWGTSGMDLTIGLGFYAAGTSGYHIFKNCLATQNSSVGFWIDVDSCQFLSCEASKNTGNGVVVNSNNNLFSDSSFSENNGNGLIISQSPTTMDNQIINCIASSNSGAGFAIFTTYNLIEKCTAVGNGGNGFWLLVTSLGNSILNCYAAHNGSYGIVDASNVVNANYVWGNSCSFNGTNYGVGISTPDNIPAATGVTYWTNVSN